MKEAVAFATLFLGLAVGPQTVQVLVSHEVSAVEILVDGRQLARIEGEPWEALCNLGESLKPRNMEAVAYSAAGIEIGRASVWLNSEMGPAAAEILVDTDPESGKVVAHVRSTSQTSERPERFTAVFDGVPVEATDPNEIVLPPHDPDQLHYLRVDLEFAGSVTSTVERTFGGSFVDDVATELTAVPLQLSGQADEAALERPYWLLAEGSEATVVDVVSGPGELIVIRDQSAQARLDRMVRRAAVSYRSVASLKRGDTVRIMSPVPKHLPRSGLDLSLYDGTPPLTSKEGGLLWFLTNIRTPRVPLRMQRLSTAVAVAGADAASSQRRRAVVLLLGPQPADNSRYAPREVRRYLEAMHVPFAVWSTEGERETPWGRAKDISSMGKFQRVTKQLVKRMQLQRIAWVRGVYHPPQISLDPSETGIRLAGT